MSLTQKKLGTGFQMFGVSQSSGTSWLSSCTSPCALDVRAVGVPIVRCPVSEPFNGGIECQACLYSCCRDPVIPPSRPPSSGYFHRIVPAAVSAEVPSGSGLGSGSRKRELVGTNQVRFPPPTTGPLSAPQVSFNLFIFQLVHCGWLRTPEAHASD